MSRLRFLKPRDLLAALLILGGAVVLWLDIKTGLWQEIVILSGIVAGLINFLLTSLFIDTWIARSNHRRWQPVTRLALIDLLHTFADRDKSEISRNRIVPRSLDPGDLNALLDQVVEERSQITESLARWSSFLAASADVKQLMAQIANLGVQLDAIRDVVIECEKSPSPEPNAEVEPLIDEFNRTAAAAVAEIQELLAR